MLKITNEAQLKEKAIYTVIRHTGLTPQIIKKLKYRDLEETQRIPRKIETRQFPTLKKRPPVFVGKEASVYLNQYLATRGNLTLGSPLFCSREGTEIDTKNLSRAFRQTLDKIEKHKSYRRLQELDHKRETKRRNFSLYSLTRYYQEKAECYEKAIAHNSNESDDFYRRLYKEKAMPFLDIESLVTIRVPKKQRYNLIAHQGFQIREMTQTIARDNEYISSILTLLYNNKGDPETGTNVEIGNNFIELWKETIERQNKNLMDGWRSRGGVKILPRLDIVEELTKTLRRIKKPFDELARTQI